MQVISKFTVICQHKFCSSLFYIKFIVTISVNAFFFAGGVDAVSSTAAVHIFSQSEVSTGTPGDGSSSHCVTTTLGSRDPIRIGHVRYKDQFRLPHSALRAQVFHVPLLYSFYQLILLFRYRIKRLKCYKFRNALCNYFQQGFGVARVHGGGANREKSLRTLPWRRREQA